jgi:putative salt-induced outer membrane protein YdiY
MREREITMDFNTIPTRSAVRIGGAVIAGPLFFLFSLSILSAEWEPEPPMPDKFDWVQLTSGEWLKGEIKVMYEDALEFDSDKLDDLVLDLEDVKQIRSAQVLNVRQRSGATATGKLLLDGNSIRIVGDSPQQFERAELLSITAGVPKERNYWDGGIVLGGNLRSGNTKEIEASANVSFQRRTVENRISLDYLGNYSSTNDVKSSNNHRANAVWDWFFSEKIFLRPIFMEYYRDPFQNIDSRFTAGTGIGYQIIDTSKTDWSIFAGPAHQTTRFEEVPPGDDSTEETWAFSAGTNFKTDLTSRIDFVYDYRFQLTSPESGRYNHHMMGTFDVDLTDALDFNLSLVWDRIEEPQANADGTLPKQDDYRLILGLGYDF